MAYVEEFESTDKVGIVFSDVGPDNEEYGISDISIQVVKEANTFRLHISSWEPITDESIPMSLGDVDRLIDWLTQQRSKMELEY